ncbi:hypothetical protein VVD49_12140 [Uliginosibacterium sp. H3]|uniref:Lipoprotein n=1 Tax=Uliginosibacterium silvisoli TaxID=3114758 RepID=A0ABU6K3K1_9RHOO|nr:hypothetical protein [Uliginosibacterium sp. H3]
MNPQSKYLALGALTLGLQGCPSSTVPFDPGSTTDTTPPVASVKVDTSLTTVDQSGVSSTHLQESREATGQVPGRPQNVVATVSTASELDITASASDNESGIKELVLKVNRTVYYIPSDPNLPPSPALMPTQELKRITNTLSNGQVPKLAITALRTGIAAERHFVNSNGTTVTGSGVVLKYFVESKNFNGQVTNTDAVTIVSGRVQ